MVYVGAYGACILREVWGGSAGFPFDSEEGWGLVISKDVVSIVYVEGKVCFWECVVEVVVDEEMCIDVGFEGGIPWEGVCYVWEICDRCWLWFAENGSTVGV